MFDTIIITAANEAQARGYRAQKPAGGRFMVVPDPGDRRVGSLGATVNALRLIKPELKGSKRVLIVHSGGDARRTPGYAAMGKAFIPMKDGRSLLDHIVEAAEKLRLPSAGGVVVVSGDVLPRFEYEKADFSLAGVTGVAYGGPAAEARRHGVYLVDDARGAASTGRAVKVSGFLQKPDVASGTHLIDTGIMFIDLETAAKMTALPVEGDIYVEFPAMLLAGYAPFNVNVVGDCDFFHVGSTREILEKLGDGKTYVEGVACRLKLGGENVVTNVPAGRFRLLTLAKGECFTCIPYGDGLWYDLKYRIDDNFKADGLWEKHKLGEIMREVDYARLLKMRRGLGAAVVRVTAPVRIDLAGGWSDTPPICNHEGGCVLNLAVKLDGKKPISVTVKPRRDKFVGIVSRDLHRRRVLKSAAELADHVDPADWCALVKAALAVTAFEFGARGVDIEICADLPKGSGMGTSSILGAATIAALLKFDDPARDVDFAEIGRLTLELEKEMRTGGGWQDQFGGMIPGLKLLSSEPGDEQHVRFESAESDWLEALLAERGLLYFTGQKRMARNILRKVLAFYGENPHNFAKILVSSLKENARAAMRAVRERDAEGLERSVNSYWRDKRLLDPGSTNERVEELERRIGDKAGAKLLTGAGGGGFLFIIAKSAADAAAIRSDLENNAPLKHSRFYPFQIDKQGLEVSCKTLVSI